MDPVAILIEKGEVPEDMRSTGRTKMTDGSRQKVHMRAYSELRKGPRQIRTYMVFGESSVETGALGVD